jgi:type I restriction enzyme S subunit
MAVLVKGASGSTIKFLTKGMIESIPLFVPTDELLTQYNDYSEAVQRKLECLKITIKNATEARDRLLPKLMSGELEV